jgi:hypothetical protein
MKSETGGKKVAEFVFAYKGPETQRAPEGEHAEPDEDRKPLPLVRDQKCRIAVYVVSKLKETDSPPHETGESYFRLECDAPKMRLEGTDIELLRKEAFGRCNEHYATKWEPYFIVEVRRIGFSNGYGTDLDFCYRECWKGTAHDGTLLLKDRHWGERDEKISAWPGEFRDREGKVIACIPKTPANKVALEQFTAKIDQIRGALADMLRPELIMHTLLNQNQLALRAPKTAPAEYVTHAPVPNEITEEMIAQVTEAIRTSGKAHIHTAFVQRRLKIGWLRGQRVIEELKKRSILGDETAAGFIILAS